MTRDSDSTPGSSRLRFLDFDLESEGAGSAVELAEERAFGCVDTSRSADTDQPGTGNMTNLVTVYEVERKVSVCAVRHTLTGYRLAYPGIPEVLPGCPLCNSNSRLSPFTHQYMTHTLNGITTQNSNPSWSRSTDSGGQPVHLRHPY